jgi:hypothetical protein
MSYQGMMDGWHGDEMECYGRCENCEECDERYYQRCDEEYESFRDEQLLN